jgi:CxxC motif-containing protein (DUF1111 family)
VFGLALSTSVAYALVASMPGRSPVNEQPAESAMLSSAGGRVFASVGCAKCHVPSLRDRNGIAVTLYSYLLLHDMGPLLDDKIQQGDAIGAEWRTTPLASIRTRQRFLHDGRAASLRDAIFAHGGEGLIVRDRFLELDEAEQQELYAFLAAL